MIHKNRKGGVRGHWVVTPAGLDTISLPCFMSEMIRRSYCNSFNFDPLPSRLLLIIVYQYKQSSRCYHCITPDLATLQPATCPYYTIRSNPTLSGHFTVIFASCSTCWMVFQFVAVGRSVECWLAGLVYYCHNNGNITLAPNLPVYMIIYLLTTKPYYMSHQFCSEIILNCLNFMLPH